MPVQASMADQLRRAVTSVTDLVFPPSKAATDPHQQHLLKTAHEYVTSLPLQMCLYFNAFFYVFWLASMIVCLQAKYSALSTLYQIIIIAIICVMTVVEIIRLYIGFVGNLMEKVPELAGFWLLTLVIQAPLILFLLLNEATHVLPLERAVDIVMTVFIFMEIIIGFVAIKNMVDYQVTKFHLQQFTNLEQIPADEAMEHDGQYREPLVTERATAHAKYA